MSTLILILPLITGFWNDLPLYAKIALLIATAVVNFVFVYYDYKKPKLKIEDMLNVMNLALWSYDNQHFRSNIMLHDTKKNKLQVKYRSNTMMGAKDAYFCISPNQGCAGEAFLYKRPTVVDLNQHPHQGYKIDSKAVWSKMQSVLSVPICDDEAHEHIIGVLNVDTDRDATSAGGFLEIPL